MEDFVFFFLVVSCLNLEIQNSNLKVYLEEKYISKRGSVLSVEREIK